MELIDADPALQVYLSYTEGEQQFGKDGPVYTSFDSIRVIPELTIRDNSVYNALIWYQGLQDAEGEGWLTEQKINMRKTQSLDEEEGFNALIQRLNDSEPVLLELRWDGFLDRVGVHRHQVLATTLIQDIGDPMLYRLYIYDPNRPLKDNQYLTIEQNVSTHFITGASNYNNWQYTFHSSQYGGNQPLRVVIHDIEF